MDLSQKRTRSVLRYLHELQPVQESNEWVKKHIAAVGLSSSQLVYKESVCNEPINKSQMCTEDEEKSRRVTFRVITNADTKIKSILE